MTPPPSHSTVRCHIPIRHWSCLPLPRSCRPKGLSLPPPGLLSNRRKELELGVLDCYRNLLTTNPNRTLRSKPMSDSWRLLPKFTNESPAERPYYQLQPTKCLLYASCFTGSLSMIPGRKRRCSRSIQSCLVRRIRFSGNQRSFTDHPFTETKERVTGFRIQEVDFLKQGPHGPRNTPPPCFPIATIPRRSRSPSSVQAIVRLHAGTLPCASRSRQPDPASIDRQQSSEIPDARSKNHSHWLQATLHTTL
jgi:hypothetical protein